MPACLGARLPERAWCLQGAGLTGRQSPTCELCRPGVGLTDRLHPRSHLTFLGGRMAKQCDRNDRGSGQGWERGGGGGALDVMCEWGYYGRACGAGACFSVKVLNALSTPTRRFVSTNHHLPEFQEIGKQKSTQLRWFLAKKRCSL